jgi:TPR repeat protein
VSVKGPDPRSRIRPTPMLKFLQYPISLYSALLAKARSATLYEEALALHGAKEYQRAFPLMKEAAELGNVHAMSIFGSMYLLGQGVPENGREAERWLKQAIEGGFENAASVLGMAYATGKAGIKINIPLARQMLTQAAERGDQKSARMLEMMNKGEGMFRHLKKAK